MSDANRYKAMFELKQADWLDACKEIDQLREKLRVAVSKFNEIIDYKLPKTDGVTDFGISWDRGHAIGSMRDICRKALAKIGDLK